MLRFLQLIGWNVLRKMQTALPYARVWHHVNASGRVLGKLAGRIALVLMGKDKPIYDKGGKCYSFMTAVL